MASLDADESAWYGSQQQGVIKSVVQLGIMNGYTDGTFHPIGNITLSEAIKMAAVVHATCNNQTISFSASDGGKWYDAYLNYCVKIELSRATNIPASMLTQHERK